MKDMDDGRKAIDLDEKKSDGTSLYITRDIAAALELVGLELESEVSAYQVSEDSGHQLKEG